jgi:hypothetical protein
MPQRKFFVATRILVFDFEHFMGGLFWPKAFLFESIAGIAPWSYNTPNNICSVFMRLTYCRFM